MPDQSCPGCRGKIPAEVTTCPQCGLILDNVSSAPQPVEGNPTGTYFRRLGILIIAAGPVLATVSHTEFLLLSLIGAATFLFGRYQG